ncbi:hypothetical protein D3C87_1884660 [compost metagenome]
MLRSGSIPVKSLAASALNNSASTGPVKRGGSPRVVGSPCDAHCASRNNCTTMVTSGMATASSSTNRATRIWGEYIGDFRKRVGAKQLP